MIDTKLIVLDGLPGSGKTTMAEWLTPQLEQWGIKIWYVPEHDTTHPLWWYQYWDGNNYLTPDFGNISIETFINTSLLKWRGLVDSMHGSDQRVLAESVFFQDAVAMFMMGDAAPARLTEYAHEVQHIAGQLNPVLIYFRQSAVTGALRRICAIRGQDFEQELVKNMERFPYLRQRGLKGLDGVGVLWQDIQNLTDTLFENYTIPKLAIETSKEDWQLYRQQILEFLNIPVSS